MTAGRKPLKQPDIIDVEPMLDTPRINTAVVTMQTIAQQEQQDAMAGVFSLGKAVGSALTAKVLGNFCAVAQIHAFREINESKAFKHLRIQMPDGSCAVAQNIDEFCRYYFGLSYRAISDHKLMMERLGEEVYENANRLGLNRSQLRLLINLPEDTRSAVEEAMRAGNKAETDSLLLSLANQLDEAKEKAEEQKAELTAKEERISVMRQLREKAEDDAAGFKKLPPDDQVDVLLANAGKTVNAALAKINGEFRQALLAIEALDQSAVGIKDFRPLAAGLVGQLQQSLTIIRDEFLLTDIIGDGVPEWMRATAHLVDGE